MFKLAKPFANDYNNTFSITYSQSIQNNFLEVFCLCRRSKMYNAPKYAKTSALLMPPGEKKAMQHGNPKYENS